MTDAVGIIGLGNAGGAVAGALARKVPVVGFDRDEARRTIAAGLGVDCVGTADAVAAGAKRIILSLPKPEASIAVTEALAQCANPPELVIETSTVTPKTAIACHEICAARGIAFVDAAIAGGVASMAAGKITFFLGGSEADKAIARPVLDLVADGIYDLGAIGTGMGTKVVNNGVMHALMVVLIEAFAMPNKLGVPSQTRIDILNREEGLLRPLMHRVQERMQRGDYQGGMSVTNARKDSVLALETAQQLGVPLFATLAAHTPYEVAEAQGMGDLDYAALARLWEQWSGVDFKTGG
jgi:3-hydroxyisobutyrate dehydrogenase-like beta-hydroxyacid dehydrogenase